MGPTLFTIRIINLQPHGLTNRIIKYADDANLLVPEKCDIVINDGFKNILKCAKKNMLKVNMSKTKEPVFHRPNARNYLASVALPGMKRVHCVKPLSGMAAE